ncbi:ATP-binding cassette domain-containing protein, partial [Candidatus Saccharibacteria bacterium]|nr:ATP-binding cassette domain-containing protein [Candidatus Saccharibacteria bacterium]
KKALDATHAKIEFSGVSFAYDKKKKVLNDVSFVIKPGQKLALVGESGGGKTTISNLLMRLYRPTRGTVMINGHDIQDVTQASVREAIATVFQDASLFSGTVRENIAYSRPSASDKEIKAAAKSANALDFVRELPDGLDTEIGERGIKLSGGQKQRIAIARALLKDAPILILDEATSSLDSRSEAVVQEALERLMKNRTVLIIAHRLSTIAHVDTIVTLKHGHVDEVGAPATLANTDGIYAQLLELQLATTEKAREKLAEFDIGA